MYIYRCLPFEWPLFLTSSLPQVDLPMATSIGDSAFAGTGLTSLSLPAATFIDSEAFYGCTGLTSGSLPATPPTRGSTIFGGIGSSGSYKAISIRVPTGSIGNYSAWPQGNTTACGGSYSYSYVKVSFVEGDN